MTHLTADPLHLPQSESNSSPHGCHGLCVCVARKKTFTFTFSRLADAFVQSDVQGRENTCTMTGDAVKHMEREGERGTVEQPSSSHT